MSELKITIVGSTGLVGTNIIKELEKSNLKIKELNLLASERSKGKIIKFKDEEIKVKETKLENMIKSDIVFFSAGSEISKKYIPELIKRNIKVIDNTSYFRMDDNTPLIVPEVNYDDIKKYDTTLVSNPNCSTIQMVLALKPLHDKYSLKKVIVSTYQAVSGSGIEALEELKQQQQIQLNNNEITNPSILPCSSDKVKYQISNNVIPQIDKFNLENGYSLEELKMMNETKKILNIKDLDISATCVRIPITNSHSESVYAEFENELEFEKVKELLKSQEGIVLKDDIVNQIYPMPIIANGSNKVFVGRIRIEENKKGIHLFIVADNIIKGAAGNAVQIAEKIFL